MVRLKYGILSTALFNIAFIGVADQLPDTISSHSLLTISASGSLEELTFGYAPDNNAQ